MSIFRAYDIRGVYPDQIDEAMAERIGKAIATFLGKDSPKIAVGMDARNSGPQLKEAMIRGLVSAGAEVADLGLIPTPLMYFAAAFGDFDAGAMLTASHNPPNYNGVKICVRGGVSIGWDDGIREIKELAESGKFREGRGSSRKMSMEDDYVRFCLDKANPGRKLRIVIDAGNGSAGKLGKMLLEAAGMEVVELFCEPDGDFPNHQPDPLKSKNLEALQEKVRETGADLGIAYDGDGDRMGIVDERGEVVDSNRVFAVFIEDALRQNPGAKIVYEVLVSKMIGELIEKLGGRGVLSKVGHTFIQNAMVKEGCALGGENSGHYFFGESFGYDDGIYAGLKFISALDDRKVSESVERFPVYPASDQFRPHCPDDKKFQVVEELSRRMREKYKVLDLDGVKVILEDGWFIVRVSNTGPELVVRWEADSPEALKRIEETVRKELSGLGIELR